MSESYISPNHVLSPKLHWSLIAVLDDEGEYQSALAIGRWNGKPVLGMRWNGGSENNLGNPQSRGIPTWFIIPDKYREAVLEGAGLSEDKMTLVRTFFPKNK